MHRLFLFLLCFIFKLSIPAVVLESGVSIESIPKELYGTWSVKGVLEDTNSLQTFKPQSMDSWTLRRVDNVITLKNPITDVEADVSVDKVENNVVVFTKKSNYTENKVLTDTVRLRIEENKFTGINILTLETFSLVDKHLMKTEKAVYKITGEKISGDSILF